MSARRILLPVVALALAGGAAMLARNWVELQRRPIEIVAEAPARPSKAVLVAVRDLHVGEFVQPDLLRWQDWPDVGTPDSYLIEGAANPDDLAGAVVRHEIIAGQPVSAQMLVKPGERGFLAAVLEPGMRAVSVPIDEASGNAGLVFPGDQVDLIVTQSIGGEGEGQDTVRRVSETVLQDVRIIAIGRKLSAKDGEDLTSGPAKTATLQVTPEQAEKVALVTDLGRLSLSLRSLANDPESAADADAPAFTWDTDVARTLLPENQPMSSIALIRGKETQLLSVRRGMSP
jgi:pilus assembly protein CpaB